MEMELNGNLAEDNSECYGRAQKEAENKAFSATATPPLILIAIQHTSPCHRRTFTVPETRNKSTCEPQK
jgi:hypothetical protein